MNDNLYRKKSMDRVRSPEDLNDYIKVSNPGIWIILAAVIVLLIGVCIWGVLGRLETKVSTVGTCSDGTLTCYVTDSDVTKITTEMSITVDGEDYQIVSVGATASRAGETLSDSIISLGGFESTDWVYSITAYADIADGNYSAEIVVESISPMSLIFN